MSYLTASTVDTEVPRGTNRDITFEILDEDSAAYNITDHTIVLRLAVPGNPDIPVIEKAAEIVNAAGGKGKFVFTPSDTIQLLTIAYDCDIHVTQDDTEETWQVFRGTLAITPTILEEVSS